MGDEDVALADAGAEYFVVGDVGLLCRGDRPDQVAGGDDGPSDLREAALLDGSAGRGPADVEHAALGQFLQERLPGGRTAEGAIRWEVGQQVR